jgi:hypothetical protein
MSISELLVNPPPPWTNLFCESITPKNGVKLPTNGGPGTTTLVSYENLTTTVTFATNPSGASFPNAVQFLKIGYQVTMFIQNASVASSVATNFTAAAGQIPARFAPANAIQVVSVGINNSAPVEVVFNINTNGSMAIGNGITNGNYTASGNAGYSSTSLTWISATP